LPEVLHTGLPEKSLQSSDGEPVTQGRHVCVVESQMGFVASSHWVFDTHAGVASVASPVMSLMNASGGLASHSCVATSQYGNSGEVHVVSQ
jgi:hypothetical protein